MPRSPRSIRFDSAVEERLAAYIGAHPEQSTSATINRLIDEGLRMNDHPGISFRSSATGRRAILAGGPEVWRIVRAVRQVRSHEPALDADEVVLVAAETAGLDASQVQRAVAYWASYPDEIDALIGVAERSEAEELANWERTQQLLSQ